MLQPKVKELLKKTLEKMYAIEVECIALQPTKKEFRGIYTFITFPYLKFSKKTPEETGEELGRYLVENSTIIAGFNVLKGFLNLEITDVAWIDVFKKIVNTKNYGFKTKTKTKILVEYSSPNTNKPLHLGHLRNIFLGSSVAKILEANGATVYKTQIINDRGIHICKSMLAWQKYGKGETPKSSGLKGDRLVGKYYVLFDNEHKKQVKVLMKGGMDKVEAEKTTPLMQEAQKMLFKWEQKDTEVYTLWKTMNSWVYEGFDTTYERIDIGFDKIYYESDTYLLGRNIVKKAVESGIFYQKKDKSIWVDLSNEGLDHKLLLRADGTSVYMTQDIGTAIQRSRDFPTIIGQVYTVGDEQDYHFKVLFLILKKLGFQWAENSYHLSYGMVNLPTGKMKSREGIIVDADDIIQEMVSTAEKKTKELGKIEHFQKKEANQLYNMLGLGALKYFLLKVDPKKKMMFNPEDSIQFNGNTGPFIQYTYARISAILKKAESFPTLALENINDNLILSDIEREGIYCLTQFGTRVKEAGEEYSPVIIVHYLYELARKYNKFYAELPIFTEKNVGVMSFRVSFSNIVADVIYRGMGLLGINVPKRM